MIRARYANIVLALCAVLLLRSDCEFLSDARVTVSFVSPTAQQKLTRGPIKIKILAHEYHARPIVYFSDDNAHYDLCIRTYGSGTDDTWVYAWDASQASLGTHILWAEGAHEMSPGSSTVDSKASVTVTIEPGAVSVRFVSPVDQESLPKGLVTLAAWAKDAQGVGMDKVEFYIDGVLGATVTTAVSDTFKCTWDNSQATAGSHSIRAKAYNKNGDTASSSITVYVKSASGGGPTYHSGQINNDETWDPAGNPHVIRGPLGVTVTGNALVTIVPGCTVEFEVGASLSASTDPGMGCGIAAVGRQAAPILFTSRSPSPAPGDWGEVYLGGNISPATQFSYCTFEYGGAPEFYNLETCEVKLEANSAAAFNHCTIRRSGGVGLLCARAGFRSFHNNAITSNGTYPVEVYPDSIPAIDPDNDLSGNDSTGVLVIRGYLNVSTTWPALSEPYVIGGNVTVGDTGYARLTIASSTTLKFKNGAFLKADRGDIVADGTGGRITFTAVSQQPPRGDFGGIFIGSGRAGDSLSGSRLINCSVSHGGDAAARYSGDIQIIATKPEIRDCDIEYGCHWGIMLWNTPVPDTGTLHRNNNFANNDSGPIYWEH